jgi:RNA polymerase sigma-70 factor (ECF subfamily)
MATFWRQGTVGQFTEERPDQVMNAREIEIIELARTDPRAFAPLYEQYYSQVHGYCLRRLGHREMAADATTQVFIRAIANLSKFRQSGSGTSSFRGWLFTIAHNIVIDTTRRSRKHYSLDSSEVVDRPENSAWLHDPQPGPEAVAVDAEERIRVRKLLDRLPERQRRIVELRMSGLNGIEIAETLRMSHSAVKSAQFRAYTALREWILEETPESSLPASGAAR